MKLIKQLCLFITLLYIATNSYGAANSSKKLSDPMLPKRLNEEKKEAGSPAEQVAAPVETLHLKAIAYDDDKSYCIINDQLLAVDDVINEYTVYEITTDEVILIDKDRKLKKLIIY